MNSFTDEIEQFLADDMSMLGELLKVVRGISPVSMVPEMALDSDGESELYFSE